MICHMMFREYGPQVIITGIKYKIIHHLLANEIAGGYNQSHMIISANQITPGHNYRYKSENVQLPIDQSNYRILT